MKVIILFNSVFGNAEKIDRANYIGSKTSGQLFEADGLSLAYRTDK